MARRGPKREGDAKPLNKPNRWRQYLQVTGQTAVRLNPDEQHSASLSHSQYLACGLSELAFQGSPRLQSESHRRLGGFGIFCWIFGHFQMDNGQVYA
jgi:hypothetical protein